MKALAALVPVLLTAAGCVCGGDVLVPDHRQPPTQAPAEQESLGRGALAPIETAELADGTRQIDVDGAQVQSAEGSIRASGVLDFDRDGDRDVLFVVLGGTDAQVLHAERESAGSLGAPSEIASATLEASCAWSRAEILGLSPQWALARAEAHCEAAPVLRTSSWLISADERPRAREHVDLAGSEGEGLVFRASDRDGDGHDDLELDVRLVTPGGAVDETLAWVSRAAGLAREGSAPEPTISSLATRARERLRRDPADALAIAERALGLREALCREAERPRLRVGGVAGVPCGDAVAAGRAHAVRAAAMVRALGAAPVRDLEALDEALEATLSLPHLGVTVRAADAALLDDAWARLATPREGGLEVHRGPELSLARDDELPRLSTLGFLDEERLLVRGPSARVLRLGEAGATSEDIAPGIGDARILDVDRHLELVAIERRCEGAVVIIAPTVTSPDISSGERREVLAMPRPAPTSCPSLSEARRRDTDGLIALGWAPQGIVLAHGRRLVVVPLDVDGVLTGAASLLGPEVPPPVPLPPGAATADLRGHALALRAGILVIDREERTVTLHRSEGFEAPRGLAIDVALSPSLSRIAWLCGDTVCWADVGSSSAPAGEPGG